MSIQGIIVGVMLICIFVLYAYGAYVRWGEWKRYEEPSEEEIKEKSIQVCPYCGHSQMSNIREVATGSINNIGGTTYSRETVGSIVFGLDSQKHSSNYTTVSKNIVKRIVKCENCNSEYDFKPFVYKTKEQIEKNWRGWRKVAIVFGIIVFCYFGIWALYFFNGY